MVQLVSAFLDIKWIVIISANSVKYRFVVNVQMKVPYVKHAFLVRYLQINVNVFLLLFLILKVMLIAVNNVIFHAKRVTDLLIIAVLHVI